MQITQRKPIELTGRGAQGPPVEPGRALDVATMGRGLCSRAPKITGCAAEAQYSDLSLIDMCRELCRMASRPVNYDNRAECFRASLSSGDLAGILSAGFGSAMTAGFSESPDTTKYTNPRTGEVESWIRERDAEDFRPFETGRLAAADSLARVGRGAPPVAASVQTGSLEAYRLLRYGRWLVFDEQDVYADKIDALLLSAHNLGQAAARLRLDLIYSLLLENPTLGLDSTALFAAGHSNQSSGALTLATLETSSALMTAQVENSVRLGLAPSALIVPEDLKGTAADILKSGVDRLMGLDLIVEPRIDAAGVRDPRDDVLRTGTATNYFLAASGKIAPTLELAYLRGSGRQPETDEYTLNGDGRYGVVHRVVFDLAAAALDFRGLVHSTGV